MEPRKRPFTEDEIREAREFRLFNTPLSERPRNWNVVEKRPARKPVLPGPVDRGEIEIEWFSEPFVIDILSDGGSGLSPDELVSNLKIVLTSGTPFNKNYQMPDCHRGMTMLHAASEAGLTLVVKYLVGEARCISDPTDDRGRTPYEVAFLEGHTDLIEFYAGLYRAREGYERRFVCFQNAAEELRDHKRANNAVAKTELVESLLPWVIALTTAHMKAAQRHIVPKGEPKVNAEYFEMTVEDFEEYVVSDNLGKIGADATVLWDKKLQGEYEENLGKAVARVPRQGIQIDMDAEGDVNKALEIMDKFRDTWIPDFISRHMIKDLEVPFAPKRVAAGGEEEGGGGSDSF